MTGREMPPEFNSCNLLDTFFPKLFQIIQDCQEYGVGGALKEKQKASSQSKLYISYSFESPPPIFSLFLVVVLFSIL